MDLVNSVTQNSNNTQVPMENQGQGDAYMASSEGQMDETMLMGAAPEVNPNDIQASQLEQEQNSRLTGDLIMDNATGNDHQHLDTEPQVIQPNVVESGKTANGKPAVPDYLKAIGMDPRKFWPKKYRFTREKPPGSHNPLTVPQRNFYENNGYLVIDQCVTPKLLDNIRSQYKQSTLVDDYLLEKLVAKNNRLLMYVKCFCDERLMLMTHQLVETFQSNDTAKAIMDNKQSQRQQLFRDWIYLPFRPIDKVVCAITAIEELNHVVLVVPGTHKVGQCSISSTLETISAAYETSHESSQKSMNRELFECAPENLSSLVEKSKRGFKYINLKAGQTLFYHPGLIHGFSDDLINFRKRQLASIAYYAAADCEYVDLRKANITHEQNPIPISLSHFKDLNPSDYSSWVGKPRLLTQETKANL